MRDPERIRVVLAAIEECWREFPDMRFGQMMDNILTYNGRKTRTEIWNMEEDELLECIRMFREERKQKIVPDWNQDESLNELSDEFYATFKERRNRT